MGYIDDVQVTTRASGSTTRVDITSRSRVGRGDLGQNPRNIRKLMRALQEKLARSG